MLLLLAVVPGRAQTVAPTRPNWSVGVRGGLGLSAYFDCSNYALWSGGALAGRYLPRAHCSLVAEALLDGRQTYQHTAGASSPWAEETAAYLFVPVGIRTGHPNSIAHVLLQAGPVLALGSTDVSADGYQPRRVTAVAVAGVEIRLNPLTQPHEVLLGLQLREGLTPTADLTNPNPYAPQPPYSYF